MWRGRLPATPLSASLASQDEALAGLRAGTFDAVLARVPVADAERWHTIRLYEEVSVVVLPVDHALTIEDECSVAALDGEVVMNPPGTGLAWDVLPGRRSIEDPAAVADAIEWCASSVGLVVVPMSLARLHHRKDLTFRPVVDAPTSSVGLVWPRDSAHPLCDELAGIVRGRGVRSSRGVEASDSGSSAASRDAVPRRAAAEKQGTGGRRPRSPQRSASRRGRPGGRKAR